jgi:hypothetical protein
LLLKKSIPGSLSTSSPLLSAHPHPINSNSLQLPEEFARYKDIFEIWRPEDIPCVFVGPENGQTPLCTGSKSLSQPLASTGAEMGSSLLPLKNFVHEILKHLRTSGSIMQIALCYLEAVHAKVPEILRDEGLGVRAYFCRSPRSSPQPKLYCRESCQIYKDPILRLPMNCSKQSV